MRSLRVHRTWLTTAVLTVLSVVLTMLASSAASAAPLEITTPPSGSRTTKPLMLASTGLDITVPIIIGLSVLALGTVMVGWAFLATGRPGRHR